MVSWTIVLCLLARSSTLLIIASDPGPEVNYMQQPSSDFSWENYTPGEIPKNAVPGGKTSDGIVTFIGQAFFGQSDDALIPGYIEQSSGALLYAMNGEFQQEKQGIKILCSSRPERFEWIPVAHVRSIRFLTQKVLVQGGFDDGYPLVIGRKAWEGASVVGKVTVSEKYEAMAFAFEKGNVYRKENFEVLSYDQQNCVFNVTTKSEVGLTQCLQKTINIVIN